MTLRYSEKLRNAGLDARIAAIGPNASLRLFGGSAEPLVIIKLPSPWMAKAEKGVARKTGNWAGLAQGRGEATSFQICDQAGGAQMIGRIPLDMTLDDPNIEINHSVVVGSFMMVSGNGDNNGILKA